MDEEEVLPQQEEDDNLAEDRNLLLEQLQAMSSQAGPASSLLRAGHNWLQGNLSNSELKARADEFESGLPEDVEDPLLLSQLDRLEEGLESGLSDQVLYALLGLGSQVKPL
ncbi:hypothetical protein ABS71_22490 [bacterium SCN 62-11]|nr:hypothetical protein [Candidatus Eremiobacteraeota bacterium]ODT55898.1 MAG: hypothetical protein ABS71_22490 [bacterium SCN 62-11]